MNRLVFDASVLVKMFFKEDHSELAEAEFDGAEQALAPDLVWIECANVVWKKWRRQEITSEQAAEIVGAILTLPLHIHSSADLLPQAMDLATATDRTVYDCLYLALALRQDCPVLTADERFFNALRAGVMGKHVRLVGA